MSTVVLISEPDIKQAKAYRLLIHQVKEGDTLKSLSQLYFKDTKHHEEIAAFNNISIALPLQQDQRLKIPIH